MADNENPPAPAVTPANPAQTSVPSSSVANHPVQPPTPARPAAPPPLTVAVQNGKTEREAQLEQELETERAGRRTAETVAAEKERLLQEERARQTAGEKPKRKKPGATYFHDEEEEENNAD